MFLINTSQFNQPENIQLFSKIKVKVFLSFMLTERSIKLTSDLGGEVGRVTRYKQLQLLIKVTSLEVQIPGSNSCQEREADWIRASAKALKERQTAVKPVWASFVTLNHTLPVCRHSCKTVSLFCSRQGKLTFFHLLLKHLHFPAPSV